MNVSLREWYHMLMLKYGGNVQKRPYILIM